MISFATSPFNRKSETRLSKSETNSKSTKSQNRKIPNANPEEVCFEFSVFQPIRIRFEFRVSCFEFLLSSRILLRKQKLNLETQMPLRAILWTRDVTEGMDLSVDWELRNRMAL